MAWKNIGTYKYSASAYSGKTDHQYYQGLSITLQYDDTSVTHTSITLRFSSKREKSPNNADNLWDGYHILWDPGTNNERLLVSKYYKQLPTTSSSFTITKTYNATSYTIPAFWLCHCGNVTPVGFSSVGKANHKLTYGINGVSTTKTAYEWFNGGFTGDRDGYVTKISSFSFYVTGIPNSYYTNVGKGSVTSVTDQKNNSFSWRATAGAAGTNNPVDRSVSEVAFIIDTGVYDSIIVNGLSGTCNLPFLDYYDTRQVAVRVITYGTYGNASYSDWVAEDVNQYFPPINPGIESGSKKPTIQQKSFQNGRLTNRKTWGYSWSAAGWYNYVSKPSGYKISIYKNGNKITGFAVSDSDNSTVIKNNNTNDCIYRDGGENCFLNFDPKEFGFIPGDYIYIGVQAYVRNGKNEIQWTVTDYNNEKHSHSLMCSSQVYSDNSYVENAGVIRVKKSDGNWTTGIVFVKKSDGDWVEAETVQVKKSNGDWAIST